MSDEQALIQAGRQTLADIELTAAAARLAVVAHVEEVTGQRLDVQAPIMNATREQLIDAGRRAQHAHEAMRLAFGWSWGDARTLGELMPQLPEDVREQIAYHLVRAGLS